MCKNYQLSIVRKKRGDKNDMFTVMDYLHLQKKAGLPGYFQVSRPNFSYLEARPPHLEAKPVFFLILDNF